MIGKRNVSLREIRTFCVAAELASFRETADALFITPSAISHQVRNLEEVLAVRLFERLSRSIELTEAGQALFADLCPLVAEFDSIIERHGRNGNRNVLRISVQPYFASEMVVPRLAEFTEHNPDIDLQLETSDESPEKHPGTADISIRIFRKPPAELVAHRLFALRLVPAASPELERRLRPDGEYVPGGVPRIVHDTRPHAWRQWEQQFGHRFGSDGRVISLDSMISVASAAERGVGAALVPLQLSDSRFESSALVKLFPEALETSDAYYLVYRHGDRSDRAIGRFRDWALERFATDRENGAL